ncbi:MAG: metallophosphoesterase [Candidatus Pacearchaeota archaeon]|nr:MAG: metallophosphoesterase [Candidatus Pacearchaeota archaeon]
MTKKIKKKKTKTRKKKLKKGEEKKEKHFKILAIGDLHGDSRQASKLAKKAKKQKVDLIILSGDLTFAESSIDYLVGPFAKRKLDVLIIPGNHETLATANFLEKIYSPQVKNIHGKGLKKEDIGIFGAGGANIGLFQLSEKEIYDTLQRGFKKVKNVKKKIMITHVHPSKTLMAKLSHFVPGSEGVRKAILKFKPDLAICSHVHEAEGIEEKIGKTKVINVGRKGKIIVV